MEAQGTQSMTEQMAGTAAYRAGDAFDRYCSMVRRMSPLDAAEEAKLLKRWMKKRDTLAARRIIEGQLRLVVHLASKYRGYGVSRDELVAEGNLGLLRALDHFDGRKVRFATYAVHWVRSAMLAHVMKSYSLVPAGTSARQARLFFRLRGERNKLEARLGHDDERVTARLAYLFNATPEEIRSHTARLSGPDNSLDVSRNDDEESSAPITLLASEEDSVDEELVRAEEAERVRTAVEKTLPELDARERLILEERLMADEEETLQALGERVGLTRERMRQLEVKLKARLRRSLEPELAA
ncbi:MAG: sigma-70 family RNA polymerase sigma factor [Myxococcaceae bacterium]